MPQQKGKGPIFSKSKVAPAAPSTQSESKRTTQSSSSQPNSFEKKLREGKLKLKKVATPVPKRSPIIPSSSENCAICLEPMKKPNQLLTTTCCHKKFHKKCIESCKTTRCPLCRQDMYEKNILENVYNKLNDTEKNYSNVKNLIKLVYKKAKTFEENQEYIFIRDIISKYIEKIILQTVKRCIKEQKTGLFIDQIIEEEFYTLYI